MICLVYGVPYPFDTLSSFPTFSNPIKKFFHKELLCKGLDSFKPIISLIIFYVPTRFITWFEICIFHKLQYLHWVFSYIYQRFFFFNTYVRNEKDTFLNNFENKKKIIIHFFNDVIKVSKWNIFNYFKYNFFFKITYIFI